MNCLLEPKAARFDQIPLGLCLGLVPQRQRLFGGIDGGADVVPNPAGPDGPEFVEQFDRPHRRNFAHQMNPPGREGQATWGKQVAQGSGQRPHGLSAAHLRRRFAVECGGAIAGMIPVQEARDFRPDVGEVAKLEARPKRRLPQTVKGLDLVIALGVVEGRKEDLHPAPQAEPHHLPQHMGMRVATTKRPVVVELFHVRQPQVAPGAQQMLTGGARGLVGVLGQMDRMTVMIEGVEVVDFLAAVHVPRDDIGSVDSVDLPCHRPGIIGRLAGHAARLRQAGGGQDALNCRQRGQGVDPQSRQLALNGSMANQAIASLGRRRRLEDVAYRHNRLSNVGGQALGRSVRRPRAIGKVGPRIASIGGPPFAEPAPAALQFATDVAAALALQPTANGFLTQRLFGGCDIHTLSSGEKVCPTTTHYDCS